MVKMVSNFSAENALAEIPPEWLAEFEAASKRTLQQRFRYSFIRTYNRC